MFAPIFCFFWSVAALAAAAFASEGVFDPRDFGAKPDGQTLCTEPIQRAIDACAAANGGTVLLAGGKFLSGTITLRSHVTLRIETGATLLGSTNIAHYPHNIPSVRSYTDNYVKQSLIAGENLENIGLVGAGLIDGQGGSFIKNRERPYENRPFLIRLVNCRDVLVEGLRLRNSAMWMQHYLACERVTVRGVHVWNYGNENNDGIDLDGCQDCTVSQCVFDSDDDGITLKSTLDRPCARITISDCIARSRCSAIKMGTESNGGFKDITINNCVVTSPIGGNGTAGRPRGLAGIALELVDGGQLERIAIANITIQGVSTPLFLRLGDRGRPFDPNRPPPAIGSFQDVVINNIVATGVSNIGCSITGQPDHPIENVSLGNLQFHFEGGGTRELAVRPVEELPKQYPECNMFGELPAYGFYCRHVRGLRFANVQLRTTEPDPRPAMVFDDVEHLTLSSFDADQWPNSLPMLSLIQTRGALISGCQPRLADGTFLRLSGSGTRRVTLVANDFSHVGKVAEFAADVAKDALSLTANQAGDK
ncbi:MAG: glycoside hydrolase family 28 protein [Planctomycetes bacterium]|nr:glycoside hydrolase family 28 protein [Planctomycetota bacterium]